MSAGDITVIAVIAVMVIGASCIIIRDKLKGRCSCGCSCKGCGQCGPIVPEEKK